MDKMFAYVDENHKAEPEKALKAYREYLPQSEEELIRLCCFITYPEISRLPHRFATQDSLMEFMQQFGNDKAFNRKMIEMSDRYAGNFGPKDRIKYELEFIQKYDPDLFESWIKTFSLSDPRLNDAWKLFSRLKKNEAIDLVLQFAVQTVQNESPLSEDSARALKSLLNSLTYISLTPERHHVVFSNKIQGLLPDIWVKRIDYSYWLEKYPDDLGLALLAYPSREPANWNGISISLLPEGPVPPSAEGNKIMVVLNTSECREYWIAQSQVPFAGMRAVPERKRADSLARYDQKIIITPRGEETDDYYVSSTSPGHRVRAARWRVTVSYINVHTGELLAEEELISDPLPDKFTSRPRDSGYSRTMPGLPWDKISAYITKLTTEPE